MQRPKRERASQKKLSGLKGAAREATFEAMALRGRQPGLTQTFESVKPRLLQRRSAEARTKALENLVARLKGETTIQVNGVRADAGL